jgi:hypothetical protein
LVLTIRFGSDTQSRNSENACPNLPHISRYIRHLPYVRHSIEFGGHQAPSELASKTLPSTLKHSKVLNVTFSEFRRENPYEVGMNDYYALFVTRVLQEMPNLKYFQCVLIPSDEPSADLGPR